MGKREQENRKRKAAAKSCQSLDTWVSKVPRQEPSDADNDSEVCDDSPPVLIPDLVAIPQYETNFNTLIKSQ